MRLPSLFIAGALLACAVPGKAEVNPAYLDLSVKPQDDFYHYANGGWIKATSMPADQLEIGTFVEVDEHNQAVLHSIVERVASASQRSPIEQLVGDFYASGMDTGAVEAAGVSPLKSEFERINAVKSAADVQLEIAHLHSMGVDVAFGFGSEQDPTNSAFVIAGSSQSGLGLPDRDYYLRDDEQSKKLRSLYEAHVAAMLHLAGDGIETGKVEAEAIMSLETSLAMASRKAEDLRDPNANTNKMSLAQLKALTPQFDWEKYFAAIGLPAPSVVDIGQPEFFKAFDRLLGSTSPSTWRAYFRWHLIHSVAPYLNQAVVDENYSFFVRVLLGGQKPRPRWKRVVATLDDEVGEALGQLYVAETFTPEAKARALRQIKSIQAALRSDIETLPWMDAPTRAKALEKLDALTIKIGYPDKWIDYSTLSIDRGPYVLNVLRAKAFSVRRDLAKIGKPWDRTEWFNTPPTVNAYYAPASNEIVFPAGILQPPFFDAKADDASNYGSIGAIMGHEMTHGFDDTGRQFDLRGNLSNWWTPESEKRFLERSSAIIKQFDAYVALDDLHVNGKLTQGENIADLGGLKIAYAAFKKVTEGKPAEIIHGFTPEQRFFLSFANNYRSIERPETLRLTVQTDPHSPDNLRVNGVLSNMPEFFEAFHVPEGAPMRRLAAVRVQIW